VRQLKSHGEEKRQKGLLKNSQDKTIGFIVDGVIVGLQDFQRTIEIRTDRHPSVNFTVYEGQEGPKPDWWMEQPLKVIVVTPEIAEELMKRMEWHPKSHR
jgi:hypothetical protein